MMITKYLSMKTLASSRVIESCSRQAKTSKCLICKLENLNSMRQRNHVILNSKLMSWTHTYQMCVSSRGTLEGAVSLEIQTCNNTTLKSWIKSDLNTRLELLKTNKMKSVCNIFRLPKMRKNFPRLK